MTKIVLHGGETTYGLDDSPNFFKEMLYDIEKKDLTILLVYFARPESQWSELQEDDTNNFKNNTDKNCTFLTASLSDFQNQLSGADIIFFKGGDGPALIETISRFKNFEGLINGKVVGGTSAGANLFSRYFYSLRGRRVIEGLGILNIKLFTHYRDQYVEEYQDLKNYDDVNMEIVTIEEGNYKVFLN